MRINLNCPYPEKDEAKALGARWDAGIKKWYIENVEDLTPFMRWIEREKPVATEGTITLREFLRMHYGEQFKSITFEAAKAFGIPYPPEKGWTHKYADRRITVTKMLNMKRMVGKKIGKKLERTGIPAPKVSDAGFMTGPKEPPAHCGCNVLPWEECEHTDAQAESAMREMLGLATC